MNVLLLVIRRPLAAMILAGSVGLGGALGLSEMGVGVFPPPVARKIHESLNYLGARANEVKGAVLGGPESASEEKEQGSHEEGQKIVVTRPTAEDVVITEPYVCQIHSRRHIDVCALEGGYLQEILIQEGQTVKKGESLFKIVPVLYQAKLDAEMAEAQLAQLEFNYSKTLAEKKVISVNEVALLHAKLEKAKAKAQLAGAELNFTDVKAPFDGIVDRLHEQLGSLIKEGDVLTTLSDNSIMWVYFNVPEARYLEYMANRDKHKDDERIELVLADGSTFSQLGKIGAIEAKFNNETGNIPFRADFPNPNRLLRHGQTGTVLIRRTVKDALVIPQRATFEILDKRYVYTVGEDHVAHQRLITIKHELEDTFVINSGLAVKDEIVLEGVREVHDGAKVEFEYRKPADALAHQKFHAE